MHTILGIQSSADIRVDRFGPIRSIREALWLHYTITVAHKYSDLLRPHVGIPLLQLSLIERTSWTQNQWPSARNSPIFRPPDVCRWLARSWTLCWLVPARSELLTKCVCEPDLLTHFSSSWCNDYQTIFMFEHTLDLERSEITYSSLRAFASVHSCLHYRRDVSICCSVVRTCVCACVCAERRTHCTSRKTNKQIHLPKKNAHQYLNVRWDCSRAMANGNAIRMHWIAKGLLSA